MPPSDLANGVPQPEAGPSSASQAAPHTQGPNGSIPPKNSDSAAAPATANGSGDKPANEGPDPAHMFAARREEELARRDRSLAEFLLMLDGYEPLIPERVTEYYLQRSGFDCSDPRLKRLLSLSAQKFVSDLARDAYHFAKLRVNGTQQGRGRPASAIDRNKVVLTMDDLSLALGEHGVNVKKPDYYL